MAIFGNNTNENSLFGDGVGRKVSSKFTLASSQTLQELHAKVDPFGNNNYTIHIYADSSGSPGTRIAYTSLLNANGTTHIEISQSGFSVPLTAGDYWLGVSTQLSTNGIRCSDTPTASCKGILSGTTVSPPSDPYGTTNHSSTNTLTVWAVVASSAVTPVADFTGTPTTGIASLSVAFTDASTNTPTSWAWDFGDGGTSTSQNPTHSYSTSGVFTVTLIATNAAGSNTKTRTGYITVSETIVYATGGGIDIW